MKFIVDQLPYYGDDCPFFEMCFYHDDHDACPRYWSKYKVTSDSNPHECEYLFEKEEH